jgi:glycosyltransferase involved in cell wall biosynthesis
MDETSKFPDVSVSICIASYNMADTIEESLSSIVEHLPRNFEIVVVDQSTDGSKAIIDEVSSTSELDFRKVFTSHPLGVGHARNLAVCAATGDIVITHVDADDWYDSRYFVALVELYLLIRERRGGDYFFSCPNMNISSREFMRNEYLLSSLPIGANEKEYRWRAYENGDFVGVRLTEEISGRIALSERKTIYRRIRRTYLRHLGMYRIGYSTRRLIQEDVVMRPWSLYSRVFRLAIIPVVWVHSLFVDELRAAPVPGKTLPEAMSESTYTVAELRREYDIDGELLLSELAEEG